MKIALEREYTQYYQQISKGIIGSRNERRAFLQSLQNDVEDYREQHPGATLSDIKDHFGYPERVVRDYIAALDEDALRHRLVGVRRRKVLNVCGLIVVSALIVFFGVVGVAICVDQSQDGGSSSITINYEEGYTQEQVESYYQDGIWKDQMSAYMETETDT